MRRFRRHRVVALVYDGLCTFEFSIAAEVFGTHRSDMPANWYRFALASLERRSARARGGLRVPAEAGLRAFRGAGTIVIPGWRDADEIPPRALLDALRRAHARGVRLVSICSGAFVLAAAGLLDGRRATTHWELADKLRARYPRIDIEPDVLYVDEGDILTSAGSAAGIDLCLHVVRRDFGAEIANRVACRMLVPPHREGGQAQYVQSPIRTDGASGLAPVIDWAVGRLQARLTVAALARRANMSARNFARRFVAETGTTPHRWLTQQRLIAAQRRLETTRESVDDVARKAGFETAAAFRHHFRIALGTTPTSYRARFARLPQDKLDA